MRDNLLLGDADADDDRMRTACAAVALDGWLDALPGGLGARAGENGNRLSGGERQRLMIARALMHRPKLLILDEPTAGVDIELRRSMWEYMRRINQDEGTTIILTTHYLEEAESLCRNVAIINNGDIVRNTSVRGLLAELNTETFLIDTSEAITDIPKIEGFEVKQLESTQLSLEVHRGQRLNDVFSALSEQGIQVVSMRNRANRLEEMFVSMVEGSGQGAIDQRVEKQEERV